MAVGARNTDFARFERLPQAVQHPALELWQFIEKEHT